MKTLAIHPIFGALTRPPLYLGITLDYFALSVIVTLVCFIGSARLTAALLYLPLHAIGWLVCYIDPHGFQLLAKKLRLPLMPNKNQWTVRCYEPF